jgi:5S rRNA maturation endonuclease (ribonuclease M5)
MDSQDAELLDQHRRTKKIKKRIWTMNISAQEIARALGGVAKGDRVLAPGPGHSPKDRSLSIKVDPSAPDGFVLNSFAGDNALDCKGYVKDKLGVRREPRPKSTNPMESMRAAAYAPSKAGKAEYIYRQADGEPYLRVTRPGFFQSHWNGKGWTNGAPKGPKIPYRLPEIIAAQHDDVLIVEGEKDADTLTEAGFVATTNSCGAGKWTSDLNSYLAGKDVYILPDNDGAGAAHARQVAGELNGIARHIRILRLPGLPAKGDVTDWMQAGGDADQLVDLLRSAEAFEPDESSESKPADGTQAAITLAYFNDIGESVTKRWIIKGVIARGETSSWIAPPGKGKSALLTDIAIHVASGTDWRGFISKERCGVVYFALERADLVKRRLAAHARRNNLTNLPIAVAGQVIDLMRPTCVSDIVAAIRTAEKRFGCDVGMIVIDTFAKGIAASGGDEDKAKDQNLTLANLRKVQEQTGVHVAIVGHTGKDESRGARGSNAHVGDTDLMVQLRGDAIKSAEIVKANDQPEGVLTRFKLETFELGRDEDGDAITTAIISAESFAGDSTGKNGPSKLSPAEKRGIEMLERAIVDSGQPPPLSNVFPQNIRVVPLALWRSYCEKGGLTSGEAEGSFRKAFARVQVSLTTKSRIGIWEELVWRAYD